MANTSNSDLLEELLYEAHRLGLRGELTSRIDIKFIKPSRHSISTLLDEYEKTFKIILKEKGLTLDK